MSNQDSSAADRGSGLTDLLGVACEDYFGHVARRVGFYPDGSGGYLLQFHTIWLPEFVELVTDVRLTADGLNMLSSALFRFMHHGSGLGRL